jgi:hypothetical protein
MSAVRIKAAMAEEKKRKKETADKQSAEQARPECWRGIFEDCDSWSWDDSIQAQAWWVAGGRMVVTPRSKTFLKRTAGKGADQDGSLKLVPAALATTVTGVPRHERSFPDQRLK